MDSGFFWMRRARKCDKLVDKGCQRADRRLNVRMIRSSKCVRFSSTRTNQDGHVRLPFSSHVINTVNSYFRDIKLWFTFKDIPTKWHDLERGIVTGCTISPILFVMGMNLIIKAAERETRGPRMQSGSIYPPTEGGLLMT